MLILYSQPEIQLKPFPRTPKIPFGTLYPKIAPLAIDLLEKLLQFDPSRRLSCDEALQHPYFTQSQSDMAQPGSGQQHYVDERAQLQAHQQAQQQAQQQALQQQQYTGRGY